MVIIVFDAMYEFVHNDPLELYFVQAKEKREDDPIVVKQIAYFEANKFVVQKREFEEIEGTKENRLRPFYSKTEEITKSS